MSTPLCRHSHSLADKRHTRGIHTYILTYITYITYIHTYIHPYIYILLNAFRCYKACYNNLVLDIKYLKINIKKGVQGGWEGGRGGEMSLVQLWIKYKAQVAGSLSWLNRAFSLSSGTRP